ncbi:hypothetical protein R1flu_017850 [Riccia fluitans]|uniref:Serine hydrolase domain-containing protein n=1 Tax=Riccia fluitans TaxID=41844 RepID=A0ABD1ZEC8_9MARC
MAAPGGAEVPAPKGGTKAPAVMAAGSSSRTGKSAKEKKSRPPARKLRVMCLHGFRTSARIMENQVEQAQWIPLLDDIVDFVMCRSAGLHGRTFPATGKSDVEKKFEAPFFEWYRANHDYTEIYGLEESISQITAFIKSRGPFDGLMGFSQGAVLVGALAGLHEKGLTFRDLDTFRFVVLIGGCKSKALFFKPAYFDPITISSLHFIGEKDFMKEGGELLVQAFTDPAVIHHPHGHLIPRLGENEAAACRAFFQKNFDLKYPVAEGTRPLEPHGKKTAR